MGEEGIDPPMVRCDGFTDRSCTYCQQQALSRGITSQISVLSFPEHASGELIALARLS